MQNLPAYYVGLIWAVERLAGPYLYANLNTARRQRNHGVGKNDNNRDNAMNTNAQTQAEQNQTETSKIENAYNVILAATSALHAIQVCRDNDEPLPDAFGNGFIIGGLLDAINLAADVLIGGAA